MVDLGARSGGCTHLTLLVFPDNQSNGRVPALHLPGLAVSLAVPRLAGSLKQEAKNAVETYSGGVQKYGVHFPQLRKGP